MQEDKLVMFRSKISHLPRIAPIILPIVSITATMVGFWLRIDSVPSIDNLVWILHCSLATGILPVSIVIGIGLLVCDVVYEKLRPLWMSLLGITSLAAVILGFVFGPMLYF